MACFGLLSIINACGASRSRLEATTAETSSAAAQGLVERLQAANSDLKSYKGIGRLTLDHASGLQTSRIAWIGSAPGKLRVEVLGQAGGPPLASIASDGDWFYVVTHHEGRYFKKRSNQASLKRLIAIPIDPLDVYTLLAGRVPIHPYGTARLTTSAGVAAIDGACDESLASQRILVLQPKWRQHPSQKIYVDGDRDRVRKIEFFDRDGKLLYRADIQKTKDVDGYQIPMTIIFSDDDQSSARIAIDRYWTGVAVAPSVFQLAPPSEPK